MIMQQQQTDKPTVTISRDGAKIILRPLPEELLSRFVVEEPCFASAPQGGIRTWKQEVPLIEKIDGYGFAPLGMLRSVVAHLKQAGFRPRPDHCRSRNLDAPAIQPKYASAIDMLRTHDRAVIRFDGSFADPARFLVETARSFPTSNVSTRETKPTSIVVIAKNCGILAGLEEAIRRQDYWQVSTVHSKCRQTKAERITLCTWENFKDNAVDPHSVDFVFVWDAQDVRVENRREILNFASRARVYGFKTYSEASHGWEKAVFGHKEGELGQPKGGNYGKSRRAVSRATSTQYSSAKRKNSRSNAEAARARIEAKHAKGQTPDVAAICHHENLIRIWDTLRPHQRTGGRTRRPDLLRLHPKPASRSSSRG